MNVFLRRFLALFRGASLDRDLDEEVAAHLALAEDEYLRQGLPPLEARRRARVDFGSIDSARTDHREARALAWLDALAFDARLSLRGVRRDWSYSLVSGVTLAIALALNTTVFTVMDAMLRRGYPLLPRSDELVFLQEHDRRGMCCISYADAADWQMHARSFQGIAVVGARSVAFRDASGRPMDLRATTVGTNLFALLGVRPVLGRDFGVSDGRAGSLPVVILSDRLWQTRFGGRPDVVGSTVRIDGRATEVIGVMPSGFEFPSAAADGLWVPILPTPEVLGRGLSPGGFIAAARLRRGVTLAEARAELERINHGLALEYPASNTDLVPSVVDHAQFTSGADARVIWTALWTASGLVLLIACANVANLSVVRNAARWSEFTTCLALGAGRSRIARQLAVEGVVLSAMAAVPAWGLVHWSMARWAVLASSRHQMLDYSVTSGTAVYLGAVATVAAVLVALAPGLRILRLSTEAALITGVRGNTHTRGTRRLVHTLVAGQMALAVVLLGAAGVLVRSLGNIVKADTGVSDPASVVVGLVRLPSEAYPTPHSRTAFLEQVLVQLRQRGGVEGVSMSGGLPVKFPGSSRPVEAEGDPGTDSAAAVVSVTPTAPGYFDVLGAPVGAGRDFTASDRDATPWVAIVNERFASLHWPGTQAVGKRVRFVERDGPGPWRQVVGVAPNIMGADPLRQQFKPLVYVPLQQEPPARTAFLLARTAGTAEALTSTVRDAILGLDHNVGLESLGTLATTFAFDRDAMDADHSELGKYSALARGFAGVALLLAAAGLGAAVAHSVAQRTREIGVRMALGATPHDVGRLVTVECAIPVALGAIVGFAAAAAVNRLFASQLVGVSQFEPSVMGLVAVALVAVALLACGVPAIRALRIDPSVALRHE